MHSFLRTAKRNISRNKVYSIINFVGLSIGMALTILLYIYVDEEVSFDKFHTKSDRIYRLKYSLPTQGMELATSPPPIAPKLADHFEEVELASRMFGRNVSIKSEKNPQDVYEETNVFFVDTTFNKIFTLEFVEGNPNTALEENKVVITEEMAIKYFGNENPIGQVLNFSNRISFVISGVVKPFPSNSHIQFNMLLAYENMYDMEPPAVASVMRQNLNNNFVISHSYTYVLLKKGADPQSVNYGMEDFLIKYANPNYLIGQQFTLMPLESIHMESTLLAEPLNTNSWSNIYLFIAVGILTLLIAAINYINLATAQSFSRIKEIGIRKAMGSSRFQLVTQFLSEAFIFTLVSFLFSFLIVYLTLPILNDLTSKQFVFLEIINTQLITLSVTVLLVITFLSGTYPAFFVTGFNVVNSLKGKRLQATEGGKLLRKSLVTFQLVVASFLLVGSIIIYQQLNYINNKSLGFKKENIVMLQLFSQNINNLFSGPDSTFQSRLSNYTNYLEAQASIKFTSRIDTQLGTGTTYRGVVPEGYSQDDNMIIANLSIDYDFLKTFNIPLVAGRPFSEDSPSDYTDSYLINETAVKEYGWGFSKDAIGKEIAVDGKKGNVIGVMKDFHFTGLTQPLTPLAANLSSRNSPLLAVKVVGNDLEKVLNTMEITWNEMFPEKSFEYTLLDDELQSQYESFNSFGVIIKYFSMIAIIISCLGLYGMILYTTQSKLKEIGIRKVLGANVISILTSIFKEFSFLILIAFALAVPISYYVAENWLAEFIYRIEISPIVFIIGFLVITIVTATTIGYNATKAALINPVDTIRNE